MKKKLLIISALFAVSSLFIFAQSEDELFGGSDFFEDDLFGDDLIEESEDTSIVSDSSRGVLFENGSVKIGGSFSSSVSAETKLYDPDEKDFGKNLKDTTLSPKLSAYLTVDARPTENLRMYTKFGMAYPFVVSAGTTLWGEVKKDINIPGGQKITAGTKVPASMIPALNKLIVNEDDKISISSAATALRDWFNLKELFTDFSVADTAFFRFGVHTVSWGAGYFFSPVSDMINTSPIDPEHPTEQVNGSLNLRTQIVFPDTVNCLWLYAIPSTNFNGASAASYLRDTALAAKYDFLLGNWEIGTGAFWKYENAPKVMSTFTGSIKKLNIFGEAVYQYGAADEWNKNKNWDNKTSIFQATIGAMYYWKDPKINLAIQYYYDSNDVDLVNRVTTNGHNIALMASFGNIFNIDHLSASLFGLVNIGKAGVSDAEKAQYGPVLEATGLEIPCLTVNASLNYSPTDSLKFNLGPSLMFTSFDKKPTVSLKIGATLGGGKY